MYFFPRKNKYISGFLHLKSKLRKNINYKTSRNGFYIFLKWKFIKHQKNALRINSPDAMEKQIIKLDK